MMRHTTSVDNVAAHHRMLHREPGLVARWRTALHAIEQRFTEAIATREDRAPNETGVVILGAMTAAGIRTAMQRWVQGGGDKSIDVHLHDVFALLDASLDTDVLLAAQAPATAGEPSPRNPRSDHDRTAAPSATATSETASSPAAATSTTTPTSTSTSSTTSTPNGHDDV